MNDVYVCLLSPPTCRCSFFFVFFQFVFDLPMLRIVLCMCTSFNYFCDAITVRIKTKIGLPKSCICEVDNVKLFISWTSGFPFYLQILYFFLLFLLYNFFPLLWGIHFICHWNVKSFIFFFDLTQNKF